MAEQGVYKTSVTCSIGYSICAPGGDWTKSRVDITSDVGPGYPEASLMQAVLRQQMLDATAACEEQIEEIANKIVEQVQVGR